jgi:hypothetical protein
MNPSAETQAVPISLSPAALMLIGAGASFFDPDAPNRGIGRQLVHSGVYWGSSYWTCHEESVDGVRGLRLDEIENAFSPEGMQRRNSVWYSFEQLRHIKIEP